MKVKLLGNHIENCSADQDYPWHPTPVGTKWLSRLGDNRGCGTEWVLFRCNDPCCDCRLMVLYDYLFDSIIAAALVAGCLRGVISRRVAEKSVLTLDDGVDGFRKSILKDFSTKDSD